MDEEEGAELDGVEGEERVEILEGEHRAGGRVADRLRITTRYMTKCVASHPPAIPQPSQEPLHTYLTQKILHPAQANPPSGRTPPPPAPALVVAGTSVRACWERVRCRSP